MRRYKFKKEYTWTSSIAYVAGLIASDGCLYNDRRHINLTSKDIEMLKTVKMILNLKGGIKTKANGYGGVGYYLQFSDVSLYDFLYNSGIKANKSLSIKSVNVPDVYYGDFLRGYFDGDGCIYGYWDKRWKNSLMYYTEFCSASLIFLDWISKQNSRLFNTERGRIKQTPRAIVLSYAKKDSEVLFKAMYHNLELPRLSRKYEKFIDFLDKDPYRDKKLIARVA